MNKFEQIIIEKKEELIDADSKKNEKERNVEIMKKVMPIFDTPGLLFHQAPTSGITSILERGILSHAFSRKIEKRLPEGATPLVQEKHGFEKISCCDPYSAINNHNLWIQNSPEWAQNRTRQSSGSPEFFARNKVMRNTPAWEERLHKSYLEEYKQKTPHNTENIFQKPEEVAEALKLGCYRPFLNDLVPIILIDPKIKRIPVKDYYGTEVVVKNRIAPRDIVGVAIQEKLAQRKLLDEMPFLNLEYFNILKRLNEVYSYGVKHSMWHRPKEMEKIYQEIDGKEKRGELSRRSNFDMDNGAGLKDLIKEMKFNLDLYATKEQTEKIEKLLVIFEKPDSFWQETAERRGENLQRFYMRELILVAKSISKIFIDKLKELSGKDVKDMKYLDLIKISSVRHNLPIYIIETGEPHKEFNVENNGKLIYPEEMSYEELLKLKAENKN